MINSDSLIQIFNEYSSIAIPISLFLSIIISLLGILPSIFITGANILFFGPIKGFIISLLGEVIGAAITFKVYRIGFKKGVESIGGKYKLIDALINSEGKRASLLVFEGRLIPFMPSGFVTLAASLSNINILRFSIATFIGKAPSIILEALVSYDLLNISENYIRLGITIISLVVLAITLKKFYKEKI